MLTVLSRERILEVPLKKLEIYCDQICRPADLYAEIKELVVSMNTGEHF